MFKPFLLSAMAGLALAATAAAAAEPLTLSWSIAPSSAGLDADQVRLTLSSWSPRGTNTTSMPVPLADLRGLSRQQLSASASLQVRFQMVRDAGRLDCEGQAGASRGSGGCRFTADEGFVAALERRGMRRPEAREQLQLALQDVGLPLLTELERQGYVRPTVDQLVAAGIHKVTVPYLRSLDALGYRAGSVDKLVAMRIFRIDAERIGALAAIGPRFKGLEPDTLIAMSIHRVTPEFVRRTIAAGYPDLTPDQAIKMRILGPMAWRLNAVPGPRP